MKEANVKLSATENELLFCCAKSFSVAKQFFYHIGELQRLEIFLYSSSLLDLFDSIMSNISAGKKNPTIR